jgi:xylulokinase
MPLVLGVDSSAGATSVELRDADDGRPFGEGQAAHPEPPTVLDRDPDTWWQALVEARHDAGGALGVAAVAAVARPAGLVALDGSGRPVRPARIGVDPDAARDARALEQILGRAEWVAASGSVPHGGLPIVKLAWLRRTDPDAFARIAWLLQPSDYLTLRLSRQAVTDRGEASRTGYWSPRDDAWRPDLLALVDDARDWEACLPAVLGPGEPAGDREGVLIAAGTGEPMAIALGLGVMPGDVVVDTDGAVFTRRERVTEDPSGGVAGYADAAGHFLPLVETIDVSSVAGALTSALGLDPTRVEQLAQQAPPGAGGLTFVPESRDAPGALLGVRGDLTPERVARAAVEGTVCALLEALDTLRDADVPVGRRLFLVGRGARSHTLRQLLADLAERPVLVPKGRRGATGACIQAAAALTGRSAAEVAANWSLHDDREVEPDPRVDAQEIRSAWRAAAGAHRESLT